jgi:hypothetical protein
LQAAGVGAWIFLDGGDANGYAGVASVGVEDVIAAQGDAVETSTVNVVFDQEDLARRTADLDAAVALGDLDGGREV